MPFHYKCKNWGLVPTLLGCGLFLLCPEAVPVRMHSGLQAGFQLKSLLYILEPKGPDCEYESINDVDRGFLHKYQHRHIITHTTMHNVYAYLEPHKSMILLTGKYLQLNLAGRGIAFCELFHMDPTTVSPLEKILLYCNYFFKYFNHCRHGTSKAEFKLNFLIYIVTTV